MLHRECLASCKHAIASDIFLAGQRNPPFNLAIIDVEDHTDFELRKACGPQCFRMALPEQFTVRCQSAIFHSLTGF